MAEEHRFQPYDSASKSLMDDHAAEVLPELLPGSTLISEKSAEISLSDSASVVAGCGGVCAETGDRNVYVFAWNEKRERISLDPSH